MTMFFSKPKTKTYTVTSPKSLGYTTDLTMNLPIGFDAPIEQINVWLRYYNLIDRTCARQLTDQQKVIDKQANEILGLQEQLKWYATEATEIWDELDAKTKKYEGDFKALGDLYICSTDQNADLRAELEETEDAYCDLYEDFEEAVRLLREVAESQLRESGKPKKEKPSGDKNQKGKPR